MARVRKRHASFIYLSIDVCSYVELQSAHVKLYLWIDRLKLDRIGKRPQQTLTMGGRDRAIETTATRSI
jgi:hypothetical protein